MPAVTLAELRTRVRQASDLESAAGFVTDVEMTGIINRACWALDGKLHTTWEDYFATVLNVTLSGTAYTLPADFYKLLFIDVNGGGSGGGWGELREYALAERNLYRNSRDTSARGNRYRIFGKSLTLLPGLAAPTQAVLAYYPQVAPLVLDSDTRDYPNGWEEWAVQKAALVCLVKEERDTSGVERLLALEEERIASEAPERVAQPLHAVDVEEFTLEDGVAPWRRQ